MSSPGRMHAASLARSPRLQRVHDLLLDGRPHSTRDIIAKAGVCAVNAVIAELRAQGAVIVCRQGRRSARGERVWLYRMTTPVPPLFAGDPR